MGDGQVGEQGEGEGHREGAVTDIGALGDAEEIGDGTVLVAEEGEAGPQPGLEGLEDRRRIDRDGGDPLVGDLG